jgi:hypothetical protein
MLLGLSLGCAIESGSGFGASSCHAVEFVTPAPRDDLAHYDVAAPASAIVGTDAAVLLIRTVVGVVNFGLTIVVGHLMRAPSCLVGLRSV